MQKEEVLKLEYLKINDEYTIATIVYQNDDVLKRDCFMDRKLEVVSGTRPEFTYPTLCVRGYKAELDNMPIIIPNEHVKFVKEKVRKLNEKYGVVKKWYPNVGDDYYTICFDFISNVSSDNWNEGYFEKQKFFKNLIFKTEEEAIFVANKMLENIDKWREEYNNQKR